MNRFAKSACLALVALAAATVPLSAQTDVAGKWLLTVHSPEGPSDVNAVFAQSGAEVTGALEIPMVGGAEMSDGMVEGSTLTFLLHLDIEGQYITVEVEAAVDGDSMEGEFYVAEFGGMPFSGKRADG